MAYNDFDCQLYFPMDKKSIGLYLFLEKNNLQKINIYSMLYFSDQ